MKDPVVIIYTREQFRLPAQKLHNFHMLLSKYLFINQILVGEFPFSQSCFQGTNVREGHQTQTEMLVNLFL